MSLTTNRDDPGLRETIQDGPQKGQQRTYLVLSEEERAKGFVRPVRTAYLHVGCRPKYPTRPLTEEEKRGPDVGYVLFEMYPPEMAPRTGRFWTRKQLQSGCGAVTTMGLALSETYARNPKFYGATFCCHCQEHFPVGVDGEFVWEPDGDPVGSDAEEAAAFFAERDRKEAEKHSGGGI